MKDFLCWFYAYNVFIFKYSLYYFTTVSFFGLNGPEINVCPFTLVQRDNVSPINQFRLLKNSWKTFLIPHKVILTVVSIRHLVFLEPKVFTLRWVSNFFRFFCFIMYLYLLLKPIFITDFTVTDVCPQLDSMSNLDSFGIFFSPMILSRFLSVKSHSFSITKKEQIRNTRLM